MRTFTVSRDGAVLATGLTDVEVTRWFARHVSHCSMRHALVHEGYRVEEDR